MAVKAFEPEMPLDSIKIGADILLSPKSFVE
jgi:hypothetical protein